MPHHLENATLSIEQRQHLQTLYRQIRNIEQELVVLRKDLNIIETSMEQDHFENLHAITDNPIIKTALQRTDALSQKIHQLENERQSLSTRLLEIAQTITQNKNTLNKIEREADLLFKSLSKSSRDIHVWKENLLKLKIFIKERFKKHRYQKEKLLHAFDILETTKKARLTKVKIFRSQFASCLQHLLQKMNLGAIKKYKQDILLLESNIMENQKQQLMLKKEHNYYSNIINHTANQYNVKNSALQEKKRGELFGRMQNLNILLASIHHEIQTLENGGDPIESYEDDLPKKLSKNDQLFEPAHAHNSANDIEIPKKMPQSKKL